MKRFTESNKSISRLAKTSYRRSSTMKRFTESNKSISRMAKAFSKKAVTDDETWDKIDVLREALGDTELVEALFRAMSREEADEMIGFLYQTYDLGIFGDEEGW